MTKGDVVRAIESRRVRLVVDSADRKRFSSLTPRQDLD
jgi:hypothetical protein